MKSIDKRDIKAAEDILERIYRSGESSENAKDMALLGLAYAETKRWRLLYSVLYRLMQTQPHEIYIEIFERFAEIYARFCCAVRRELLSLYDKKQLGLFS